MITVPADHWIDELALAAKRSAANRRMDRELVSTPPACINHSSRWPTLGATVRPITVSLPGELASGIAFAADAKGDQLLAWKGCTLAGTCVLRDALRGARQLIRLAAATRQR